MATTNKKYAIVDFDNNEIHIIDSENLQSELSEMTDEDYGVTVDYIQVIDLSTAKVKSVTESKQFKLHDIK